MAGDAPIPAVPVGVRPADVGVGTAVTAAVTKQIATSARSFTRDLLRRFLTVLEEHLFNHESF